MIILLGFPKSGTTSFTYLFSKLGYDSFHWVYEHDKDFIGTRIKDAKLNKKKLLSFIKKNPKKDIAITQMDVCMNENNCYWPQIIDYELLYEQYPNAVYILNTRDPRDILNSMKKWQDFDKRMFKYNPELFVSFTGPNDDKMIKLIQTHYSNVIKFFSQQKKSKFLVYHIIKDKISKLNKYIDTKNLSFPTANKGIDNKLNKENLKEKEEKNDNIDNENNSDEKISNSKIPDIKNKKK